MTSTKIMINNNVVFNIDAIDTSCGSSISGVNHIGQTIVGNSFLKIVSKNTMMNKLAFIIPIFVLDKLLIFSNFIAVL